MTTFFAVFIILHGLAHLWYVVLSLGVIPFKPEMGWTGESWLLTWVLGDRRARTLAAILYALAALGFVAAGAGLLMGQLWVPPLLIGSAVVSIVTIGLYWDGSSSKIIEKGLLGFLINGLVIIGVGDFNFPAGIS